MSSDARRSEKKKKQQKTITLHRAGYRTIGQPVSILFKRGKRFLTFIGDEASEPLKFHKKRLALHWILAPPTSFIIRWTTMKYWDFSVKSKSILLLVVTSEITIFIFTVSKNGLFMNSGLKVLPKGLKCSILVWNYGEDVDVTYCAAVTLLLHATSGGLSLTVAFSLCRFLAFYCFKCYLASFSRYKIMFLPNIMPP